MQSNQLVAGTMCFAKAGLTGLSGAATTFTTGVAVLYSLLGKAFNKAAVAGGATPTLDAITGKAITILPGFGTVILWCLDAAGTVKLVQGSVEVLDKDSNGFAAAPPQFPLLDDTAGRLRRSVYKRLQGPPIVAISERAFGFDLRETIINGWTGG